MKSKVLAGLVLAMGMASLGLAHAVLLEATPAPNGTLPGPDINIQLRFNSRIDSQRSRLALVLPDRSVRALRLERQASPATLNSHMTGLGTGVYTLQWQVLAADGHISRGEVPFQVN
jgi:methionine-rich copper-binding protein CopC